MTVTAVDLFCGIGGLTRGVINSGIKVKAGFDIDEKCRYAYEHNNGATFICEDIALLSSSDIEKYYENDDVRVIIGCAPCQPFSSNTPKAHAGRKNPKWDMLNQYARIISEIIPDIITMENVPQLKGTEPFLDFIKVLEQNEYHYSYSIVDCEEYGIPQKRKRLVLLASKYGPIFMRSTEGYTRKTVKDAIGSLEYLSNGGISPLDPLHRCQKLSDINLKRIKHSKPGGSWDDWPDELVLKCHKNPKGSTFRAAYGRMSWDCASPTITTEFINYGSGRFGHPDQNRALSLREGALIQTFPPNYEFTPGNNIDSIATTATHIGNAVPVKLGEVIGTSILDHLKEYGVINGR